MSTSVAQTRNMSVELTSFGVERNIFSILKISVVCGFSTDLYM